MMLHLYELDAYHRASGHIHRWYLCAGSRGYQSRGDDDPARVTWLPLVGQWASVSVQAAGDGGSRISRDDLRLINVRPTDDLTRCANVRDLTAGVWLRVPLGLRPLNALLTDYVVQAIVEKEVDETAPYSAAVTLWRAKSGIMVPDRTELRLPLWDRLADFDAPVLDPEAKYLGTGGLEGPSSLKDSAKERCWGWCPIVSPTYLGVIGGKPTYSVNGGRPIEGVPRAWDKGGAITLVTGTPSSGQYSVDLATGVITLGGAKADDLRCEVKGDKTGGVWRRYIGEIVAHLATTHSGIIAAADVSGIDALPRTVGLYLPAGDATTHRAAYDRLVGSVARGRWYTDLTDRLVVTRLPRATAVTPTRRYRKTAGEADGLKPTGSSGSVPPKQIIVQFAENASPTEITASTASADDVNLWSKAWREAASAVDAAVAAAWGKSTKVERIDTALTLRADAEAEAPLWLAERANPPRQFSLRVNDSAPGLWIGDAVTVTDDVAGFETGATVVVTGRTNRDRGGGATLYVER